jgi:hypothetical protein
MAATTPIAPRSLVSHRALGSEAVYRVLHTEGDLVAVEVVECPGLARGTALRFTADAVRAMDHRDAPASAPAGGTFPRLREVVAPVATR